nr:MAG TPA: 50S ribosomal subunit [Bacteriophage sp.]
MKNNVTRLSICPRCGKPFTELPALSRLDNETLICPDCGTREALESIGVKSDEQEQILATIHRHIHS